MRKSTYGKWIIVLLLCIPAAYLVLQIYRVIDQTYVTQVAVRYTMSDTIACRGILGMTETVVSYDGNGLLGYQAANGERVAAGAPVAAVFSAGAPAQNSAYARQLTRELDTLRKSQGGTTGADVEAMLRQTYAGLYDMLDCVETGNYAALAPARAQVQLAMNRTQLLTGRAADFEPRIAALTERAANLNTGETALISAPVAGYFVAGEDSDAQVYSTEQLAAMSPAELQTAAQADAPPSGAGVAGKIIVDYKWRFFTTVTLEQADQIERETQLSIAFAAVSQERIPAAVQSIVRDEAAGIAKVELLCDYINANVVVQEHADAVLHFRDYEGLRIDKRAERYQGEVRGVYVRDGSLTYFRRIEPIFEDAKYYLVPLVPDETQSDRPPANEVRMFDTVIVEGKNLTDAKIITAIPNASASASDAQATASGASTEVSALVTSAPSESTQTPVS